MLHTWACAFQPEISGPRVANVGLQADVDLEVGEQWRGGPVLNDAGSSLRSSSNSDSG